MPGRVSTRAGATTPAGPAPLHAHVRWRTRRDMPEVLAIEHASFEYPWCEEEFLRVLRRRNCIGMVAEHGGRVVGFMVYELHKDRLHLLDFAVLPESRRQGIGHQMVAKLVGKLSSHRRTRIALGVRETNLAAQLFFRIQGFRAIGVAREHYPDTGEDGYLLQYLLDDSVADAPAVPAWATPDDGTGGR